jgi:branched-chain amino acid transport system ATP-binding protein
VPETEAIPNILEARKITKTFGGLVAVSAVDFDIPERSIVSLIGPNGAGKTTFFNMVSGLMRPTTGSFVFLGHDVTRLGPHKRAQMGLGSSGL